MAETPDWNAWSQTLYRNWEQGMKTWWDQVLDDPQVLGTMGQQLSAQARARKSYEQAVDQSLEQAHLPTRADLTRVARIATLLEEQVLRLEDHVLELSDQLARTEKEALTARIEAAEARIELQDTLARIDEKLAALAPAPPARKRTPSKSGGSK